MEYCFSKTFFNQKFTDVEKKTKQALKAEGFRIISELDIAKTFKEKLIINFKPYKILGACNPRFAHQAIVAEDNIGVFLPCNIVLTEMNRKDTIKVSIVNPDAAMISVDNTKLAEIANEITGKLHRILNSIH